MIKSIAQLIGIAVIVALSVAAYNISAKMDARSIDILSTNLSWAGVACIFSITFPLGLVFAVVFWMRIRAHNIRDYGHDGIGDVPMVLPRRHSRGTLPSPHYQLPGPTDQPWPQQDPWGYSQPSHPQETLVTVLPPATPDDPEWE
ncbi:MAG: hypothetical protein KC643_25840 [Nitrospira sp.]|nr:hypothetical protein [Nitrospira sp.]